MRRAWQKVELHDEVVTAQGLTRLPSSDHIAVTFAEIHEDFTEMFGGAVIASSFYGFLLSHSLSQHGSHFTDHAQPRELRALQP